MTSGPRGEPVESSAWRFTFPDAALGARSRERLVALALDAVSGARGEPLRRSRHASTYRILMTGEVLDAGIERVFLKVLDPPSGAAALLKWVWRGAVTNHLLRVVGKLRRDGIDAPRVLMTGYDRASGREVAAIEGMAGRMVSYYMGRRSHTASGTRRELLRALGGEVARLHRLGYVHGDLTPYNVIVTSVSPPRFGFIDHERTRRRVVLSVGRHRMRNLVQLGRFDIPGLSRTDRMRVLAAYAEAMKLDRRRTFRVVARMLGARLARDRARVEGGSGGSACVMVGGHRVGEN